MNLTKLKHLSNTVALAATLLAPLAAHATTVFSSLPLAGTPQGGVGNSVGTDPGPNQPFLASQFRTTGSGSLTDIMLGLYLISGGSLATVTLHADNAGAIGALLATGTGMPTVETITLTTSTTPAFLDVAMSSTILAANTLYWVEVTAGSPDDNWLVSTTPGKSLGGGNSALAYQFGVNVAGPAAVPEPASALLVGVGLAGLALARRRRRA